MSATLTFYGVVLSVHIMAVVVAFGVCLGNPVIKPRARSRHPESMAVIHEMGELRATTTRVLLECAYFTPRERKLGELARRDLGEGGGGTLSAEYDELFQQVAVVAYANCALVLIAIFFMAAKP